ncbi:hypothetical protein PHYC_02553 [Phycisphaerales bacterium]|nr:hypothetical protein PHYC_02553 [Phycisphaerales bacterium]
MRTCAILVLLMACGTASAQDVAPASPPADAQPDLDELLGLKKPGEAAPATLDTTRTELDRHLKPEEVTDEFAQAVGLMDESAHRLASAKDTGLDTQRLQSDALKRLDKLIEEAQQRGGQKKQKQRQQQQQQDQQQAQKQSSQQQSDPQPSNQAGTPQVGQQSGALTPPRPAESASWGNLPEHVRQALTEGRSDRFSSLYQQMTEQYYKRLAEEPRPGARR